MSTIPLIRALALALFGLSGCIEPNHDHCGRNEGDQTCAQSSVETPFCSVCIADNDGCVAVEAAPACQAGSGASHSSSSAVTGSSTSTSTSTATSTATSTSTSTSTSTEGSTSSGEPPASCGDGILDAGEQCDQEDFGEASCTNLGYGGGELSCSESCEFDKSDCCLGEEAECNLLGSPKCCRGLTCSLTGGGLTTCQ